MNKKLAIFCASTMDADKRYLKRIDELIGQLSLEFDIVYGGSNTGYMQAVAEKVKSSQGYLIGVMPKFLEWKELRYEACDEWVETTNMNTRKEKMIEISDFFLALPGGVGTYEEVADVLSWNHIGLINKPVVLVNYDGFYDGLIAQIHRGIEDGFILESLLNSLLVSSDSSEIIDFLRKSKSDEIWDIFDENKKRLAKVIKKSQFHTLKSHEYHLEVGLIIRDEQKVVLIQENNLWKIPSGPVLAYESSLEALKRIISQKLMIDFDQLELNLRFEERVNQTHIEYYEVEARDMNFQQSKMEFFTLQDVLKLQNEGKSEISVNQMAMLFPWNHTL